MTIRQENWGYFRKNHSEIHEAYEQFGQAVAKHGGPLDAKTQALVKIGIAAASQYDQALRRHVEKAREAGCSDEEIEHAVLLVASTSGFPRMMAAMAIWREEKSI